ncbi:CPBP family intramembrane metalloprotease [Mammaliicoccus sciuri]|uniref:CPBP family intramembrane glutamic endopeptidase n=1 Tax=Mammaliicoccus sciuri TaxID=1296 RepID=UPI001C4FC6BB|nr:CPBP family intramembrane glutamic endopeptidase [Mammaliicoccus sciuri]MCD3220697.1 CPBP family intramembrane metalloprotease [Mammaliicoccus sciuri]
MVNFKKSLQFILLTTFLLILIFLLSKILPFTNYTNKFIAQLIIVLIVVLYFKLNNKLGLFNFKVIPFFKGLWLGKYILVIILFNVITNFETITSIEFTFTTIILIVLANVTIGLFEEIICRGMIFNSFLKNNSPVKAAFISSCIFGVIHLLNLTHTNDYIGTFSQVIYATFLGVLFSAIYYKTKNLWSVIFLHSILDISSGFYDISNSGKNIVENQTDIISGFISVIIILPSLVIGYRIIKH